MAKLTTVRLSAAATLIGGAAAFAGTRATHPLPLHNIATLQSSASQSSQWTGPAGPLGPNRIVSTHSSKVLLSGSSLLSLHASKRGGAMARKKRGSSKDSSSGSGFGSSKSKTNPPKDEESNDNDAAESAMEYTEAPTAKESVVRGKPQGEGGRQIYSLPALYDLAFGYRSYEDEVDFLIGAHRKYCGPDWANNCGSGGGLDILELAAGPARHSITALRENGNDAVRSATAVDLSEDMIAYGRENADIELGDAGVDGRRDAFTYWKGDMRQYCPTADDDRRAKTVDSAWILLGSMQHLTTNDDVIDCFCSTSFALRDGGTLIIELPHPRETFTMVECTRNGWEVPLEDEDGVEYGELKVIWGDDDDAFDPIRQVRDCTVSLRLTGKDGKPIASDGDDSGADASVQSVREVVPMRLFTAQEIDALARCAGLSLVAMYGALDDEVSVDSEDEAFRLVCVLRKD